MKIGDRVTNWAIIRDSQPKELTGTIIEIGSAWYCSGRSEYAVKTYTVQWDQGFTDWHIGKHLRRTSS